MKNANMPAMPQPFAMTEAECGTPETHLQDHEIMNGLTKREIIAMHTMASLLGGVMANSDASARTTPKEAVQVAIKYTDALLKELEK